jgi:NAD(P)-dependent dehydrogenase (short-subunit alcohol dehydrogenase family)
MTDLKGKTALVTGSTSGIGRATAVALAARGAHVLVVGRNEQRAKDVVAEIEGIGGSATFRLTTLGTSNRPGSWWSGPLRRVTVTSTS